MTENERKYQDLLIRLETRLASMEKSVAGIETFIINRDCGANMERIKSLEWIVRTALGASVVAMIKAFWPNGG